MEDKEILLKLVDSHGIIDESIQKKIGRDRAIVYCVKLLQENNIEPTFQRICVSCFKIFPESFSFVEFPEYPDSRVVRNCLWHCVHDSKGWLVGSDKRNYSLTQKGEDEVIPIFKKLIETDMDVDSLPIFLKIRGKTKRELVTKPTDKEVNILNHIRDSQGFLLFEKNRVEVRSVDIKKSLGGDRYVSNGFIRKKLNDALKACEILDDKDIKKYLIWIKENYLGK